MRRPVRLRRCNQVVDEGFAIETVAAKREQFLELIDYQHHPRPVSELAGEEALQAMLIATKFIQERGTFVFAVGRRVQQAVDEGVERIGSRRQHPHVVNRGCRSGPIALAYGSPARERGHQAGSHYRGLSAAGGPEHGEE